MKMWIPLFMLFCCSTKVLCTVSELTVKTSFGRMTGLVDDEVKFGNDLRTGLRFLGIPFAKPPTGSKRFKKPEPETVVPNTYNATYSRNICPQKVMPLNSNSAGMDEDCLYLNVFAPGSALSAASTYPVMIYIYGGGFQWGLSDIYFADVLSSFNDVIVVTFNYRVNVLGFLDDGTGAFANNGLHDQKLAIDWVHNHIASFGGDPTKVTLLGESAGGASVMYQALNPENEGRFQRVIAQSGSVLAGWAYQSNPREIYDIYTAKLNCTRGSSSDVLACLRSKSVDNLISILDSTINFGPTVDRQFLPTDPLFLFTNYTRETSQSLRVFSDIDFLTGFNSKDGADVILDGWSISLNESGISLDDGVPRVFFDSIFIPSVVRQISGETSIPSVSSAMIHEYVDWEEPNDSKMVRNAMIDISTDLYFLLPAIRAARTHARNTNGNNTFVYQFSHKREFLSSDPEWLNGANHADEVAYVLGISETAFANAGVPRQLYASVPSNEITIARSMMNYWTNFAKTGNPNGIDVGNTEYPTWPPYDVEMESYIDLTVNLTVSSIQRHPAASRVNFWTNVVPSLNTAQCENTTCEVCKTSSAMTFKIHILVCLLPLLLVPLSYF